VEKDIEIESRAEQSRAERERECPPKRRGKKYVCEE
jgi:hypothetical protein